MDIDGVMKAGFSLKGGPDTLGLEILRTVIKHYQRIDDLNAGFQFAEGAKNHVAAATAGGEGGAASHVSFLEGLRRNLREKWRPRGAQDLVRTEIPLAEFNHSVSMALLDAAVEARDVDAVIRALGLFSGDLSLLADSLISRPLSLAAAAGNRGGEFLVYGLFIPFFPDFVQLVIATDCRDYADALRHHKVNVIQSVLRIFRQVGVRKKDLEEFYARVLAPQATTSREDLNMFLWSVAFSSVFAKQHFHRPPSYPQVLS